MASQYESGFYLDNGYYGGQEYLGADIDEALESLGGDIRALVHDHIFTDWEIDREGIAHNIAYEGLLDQTLDSIARSALDSIMNSTTADEGPVFGNVYWWEDGFSDSPRPPPDAWKPPVTNVKWTGNAKASKSVKSRKTTAGKPKKAPAKTGSRPKAKTGRR